MHFPVWKPESMTLGHKSNLQSSFISIFRLCCIKWVTDLIGNDIAVALSRCLCSSWQWMDEVTAFLLLYKAPHLPQNKFEAIINGRVQQKLLWAVPCESDLCALRDLRRVDVMKFTKHHEVGVSVLVLLTSVKVFIYQTIWLLFFYVRFAVFYV